MSSRDLDFRVLGPLAVVRDGHEVPLGGRRQRLVLALLILEAGRLVPAERLVDDIWGAQAPASHTGPLRTYVWQLRRLLGPETARDPAAHRLLVSRGGGYLLDIDRKQVDAVRFEICFADARHGAASGRVPRALDRLDEAIALWRGPAFGDLAAEPALQTEAMRLDQLLLGAKELRAELLLASGRHSEVSAELAALARAHPQRERLWAMLMTALYRSGRQGDALRCYHEARARLIEEMGLDPGPELRHLEQAILRQDPRLDWQPRPAPRLEDAGVRPRAGVNGRPDEARSAAEPARHNLPRQLTSFVGRWSERALVVDALKDSRLVTLLGSGGCGKTRLSLAVAEAVLPRFKGGVWFVDLAAVSDPAHVARAVAAPLGVETDHTDQFDQVCRRIGPEQLLLVLDNCEHLVETVAEITEQLLLRCPGLRILATSREELGLGAELVWRVPAMSLPDLELAVGRTRDPYLSSEAVELFIERGRAALTGFSPTGEALDTVAQICRRLDGIPLAIELAAALVGSLPLSGIAERLDDRLGLLEGGRRQGIPRHRTLRATLDWSFELLDEPAQRLFVHLGVFVGDFTLAAAEAVAGDPADPLAVVRGLARLVATSMVGCVSGAEGTERYRMLETIRQYAQERLAELDDADEIHWRHARYYADFAAEAERHVHGAAASEWLARVVSELPNLRAAVAWAMAHDDLETGLRLAGSLRWFFARMLLLGEAARWLAVGVARRAELPPDLRLMALTAASTVAWMQGEFSRTRELGEEGVAIARELGDAHQLAIALIVRGGAAVYEGDLARGEECFEEARVLCGRLGDRWGMAWLLTGWAVASRRAGRLDRARRQLEESLVLFRALDDRHGQVLPLVNLALAAQEEGHVDEALARATDAAGLATALQDRQLQHVSICVLGRVDLSLGHRARARELLLHSIRDFPGAHNRHMLAVALEGLAELCALAGHHDQAVALLGFTQEMRERWRISLSGARARERDEWLEEARGVIGGERVKQELDRGRTLDFDDAVALAEGTTAELAAESGRLAFTGGGSTR